MRQRHNPIRWLLLLATLFLSAQAGAVTFKIATLAPDGTAWMQEMRTAAEEISKRTEGRVEFKFYPGGVMGNDKSVMRKIRVNQIQGGAVTSGALTDLYPDMDLYGLPLRFNSYEEVSYVRERMDSELKAGLAKKGLVALAITEGGFAYLMADKPLSGIEDLKGQKVWLPEGDVISQTIFEAAGISPVSLPVTDVYTGLQTGLIDTIATTPSAAIALQWHTRVSYVTDYPLLLVVGVFAVDKRSFDRLSQADQAVVSQLVSEAFGRLDNINRTDNQEARKALKAQGIDFVEPTPDEVARWHALADEAVSTLGAQGVYSEELFHQMESYLENFRNTRAHAH